jgi:hypothetical protein
VSSVTTTVARSWLVDVPGLDDLIREQLVEIPVGSEAALAEPGLRNLRTTLATAQTAWVALGRPMDASTVTLSLDTTGLSGGQLAAVKRVIGGRLVTPSNRDRLGQALIALAGQL